MAELLIGDVQALLDGGDVDLPDTQFFLVRRRVVPGVHQDTGFGDAITVVHQSLGSPFSAYGNFLQQFKINTFDRALENPGLRERASDWLVGRQNGKGRSIVSRIIFDDPVECSDGWMVDAEADISTGTIAEQTITARFQGSKLTLYESGVKYEVENILSAERNDAEPFHQIVKNRTDIVRQMAIAHLTAYHRFVSH